MIKISENYQLKHNSLSLLMPLNFLHQKKIHEDDLSHGLDNRGSSGQHARVMSALSFQDHRRPREVAR